tara:strand:- start:5849 stop:6313 length:465 start_codon:yes stop_codon:yes gene_type:complete
MTDKKSTIWQEELRKHLDNATPTEDWRKQVEQDDRIIQFDNGELLEGNMGEGKAEVVKAIAEHEKLHAKAKAELERYNVAEDMHINAQLRQSIGLPDLDEESKRSDRFFGMRLKGKSIDDIENTFLAMFAEFVSLMALLIGVLGFGILLWAIFS